MLRKIGIVGVLSTATFGFLSLPASADQATVQTVDQTATVIGNHNRVIQVNNQITVNKAGNNGQKPQNWKERAIDYYQDHKQEKKE
jgi:uncharacterized membrane protein